MTRLREIATQTARLVELGREPVATIEAALGRAVDEMADHAGLVVQCLPRQMARVALAVSREPGGPAAIARALGMRPQHVQRMLAKLTARGVVARGRGRLATYRLVGCKQPVGDSLEVRVADALRRLGAAKPKAIAHVIGANPDRVGDVLLNGAAAGRFQRIRRGTYTLNHTSEKGSP